jgi:hypothetical protein
VVYVERNVQVLTEDAINCDQEEDVNERNSGDKPNAMGLDPEEVIDCLCYKYITLILLPNLDGE